MTVKKREGMKKQIWFVVLFGINNAETRTEMSEQIIRANRRDSSSGSVLY
jgi:hypothetical protein